MSAQVQFINCQLSLIHIPLPLYAHFLKPILELITASGRSEYDGSTGDDFATSDLSLEATVDACFVNVSLTPVECSVVCSVTAAKELFQPLLLALGTEERKEVVFGVDNFVAIQVDGQGLDAGQRVLNLTSPLSLAGIPIFFITTYFSDYLLVPLQSQGDVVQALERQGFAFEEGEKPFFSPMQSTSMSLSTYLDAVPRTPPPATLAELQKKTFTILKNQNIKPMVHPEIQIILCAGQKGSKASDDQLYLGLVRCLLQQPQFLSLTITDTEPPSLYLEKSLLKHFPQPDVLLGTKSDILIPIMLDLRQLPLECTGIICGVAGKLAGGNSGQLGDIASVEMSYLSTAMAGSVMVAEEELEQAMLALEQ